MTQALKQRLIGAVVLLALAVIFLPMLLEGPVERTRVDVPIDVPPRPEVSANEALPAAGFTDQPSPGERYADRPRPVPEATGEAPPAGTSADGASAGAGNGASAESAEAPPAPTGGDDAIADGGPDAGPGSWAVQVGAFAEQSNALGLRDRLREQGFAVYVDRASAEEGAIYRVRVGPAAEREAAEAMARELEAEAGMEGLVLPH